MTTLAHAVANHWHAVERDLLALGFRAEDIGTRLHIGELVSIVIAAPPGSAVRDALEQGWTREAHLLANLAERDAGLINLPGRYPRPGIPAAAPAPAKAGSMESLTVVEFEKRRQAKLRRGKGAKPVV